AWLRPAHAFCVSSTVGTQSLAREAAAVGVRGRRLLGRYYTRLPLDAVTVSRLCQTRARSPLDVATAYA
ncbi:hypothetical protein B296_00002617, partial [Ensete ventricosum]